MAASYHRNARPISKLKFRTLVLPLELLARNVGRPRGQRQNHCTTLKFCLTPRLHQTSQAVKLRSSAMIRLGHRVLIVFPFAAISSWPFAQVRMRPAPS